MSSYKELQEQIALLKDEAAVARKAGIKESISAIREQLAIYDIALEELVGALGKPLKTRTANTTLAPKYRDPNSSKTWTGRGRRPLWVKGDLSDYLIR